MMEKFVFLDDKGEPIPHLTYEESSTSWSGYHDSMRGWATIISFAPLLLDEVGKNFAMWENKPDLGKGQVSLDREEKDRLLQSIRSIREEFSGAVVTREQIIEAVKAKPTRFEDKFEYMFPALPELKQELRDPRSGKLYSSLMGEDQKPGPSPQPM
jgi:hypothetical protein